MITVCELGQILDKASRPFNGRSGDFHSSIGSSSQFVKRIMPAELPVAVPSLTRRSLVKHADDAVVRGIIAAEALSTEGYDGGGNDGQAPLCDLCLSSCMG